MCATKRAMMRVVLYSPLHPEPEMHCSGCRICEIACSLYHERLVNLQKARIRVVSTRYGMDSPTVCHQCAIPQCVKACAVDAFILDRKLGVFTVQEDKCTGCGLCVDACPFGAIFIYPQTSKALKCDLCGGEPWCARYCPPGILKTSTNTIAKLKRRELVNRIGAPSKDVVTHRYHLPWTTENGPAH